MRRPWFPKPYADLVAEFQLWRGRLNERLAK